MTEHEWLALYERLQIPQELARIMLAAVLVEGGLGPVFPVGDNGQSYGPYQMHDRGAGAGIPVHLREDPEWSSRYMYEREFRPAYEEGRRRGYQGEDLAVWTYLRAERPLGWQGPARPGLDSAAARRFRAAYRRVMSALNPTEPPLISAAQTLVGTPYGLPPGPGQLDCSLFVLRAAELAGYRIPPGVRTAEHIRLACELVTSDDAGWDNERVERGDLLFFERTYAGNPGERATHVGIALLGGEMLDANDARGTVGVTNIRTPYWQERLFEARRLPAAWLGGAAPAPAVDLGWYRALERDVLPAVLRELEQAAQALARAANELRRHIQPTE